MEEGAVTRPRPEMREIRAWTYRLPLDEATAPLRLIINLQPPHDAVPLANVDGTTERPSTFANASAVPLEALAPSEIPVIPMDDAAFRLGAFVNNATALTTRADASRKWRYYPRRFVRRVDNITRRAFRRARRKIAPKLTPRILAFLLGKEQAAIVEKVLAEAPVPKAIPGVAG